MTGRDLFETAFFGTEQGDRLFRPAVDRVGQAQRPDPKVVVCPGLEKHLFNGVGRRVAPRLHKHDGGRLVGQHVDGVAWRGIHRFSTGSFQLDLVETIFIDDKTGREHPISARGQRGRVGLVEHQPAGRCAHGRKHRHAHFSTLQHRNVAAVLDETRLETGVGGEVILQFEVLGIRQVDDLERKVPGLHAVRFDEIVGLVSHIEQERLELADHRLLTLERFDRDQRDPLVRVAGTGPHEQVHVVGLEPHQLGRDGEVGAAGDGRVARQDFDAVRAGSLQAPGRRHQRRGPVPQIGRPKKEHQQRHDGDADQIAR